MKKQINQKYSKSSEVSSDSSPSSSVVDEKLPRKLQAVMNDYLSIDKRHKHSDIKVFVEDKSGEIRWSCPCNPHRKGPYEWQGVDKMKRHTAGRLHLEYVETRKAPKKTKKKPVTEAALKAKTEEVIFKYVSINPKNHRQDDIHITIDPDTEAIWWKCKCSNNRSRGFLWQGLHNMKTHASSGPHTTFVQNRSTIEDGHNLINKFERKFGGKGKPFDLVSWWQGQGLFPLMLEWEYNDNYQEEARCGYCECLVGRTNDEEAFKKHVAEKTHQTNVRKIHDETKRSLNKPPVQSKKRERSPEPEVKKVIPATKPKDAVVEKTKKDTDVPIIEIKEDLPRNSIRPSGPIRYRKRERSPSPPMESDDKEIEKELKKYFIERKKAFIDHIYKKAYECANEDKNIEAEIQERYKKLVSKTLDEIFE